MKIEINLGLSAYANARRYATLHVSRQRMGRIVSFGNDDAVSKQLCYLFSVTMTRKGIQRRRSKRQSNQQKRFSLNLVLFFLV